LTQDSGLEKKKLVAEIVLDEISHQWFGNLVTMRYWDGLWLKKGFTTCMSWIAEDKFFPEWHV
jgi:aminopeptidase 2